MTPIKRNHCRGRPTCACPPSHQEQTQAPMEIRSTGRVSSVDLEKEDAYQEGLLMANWAQM